MMRHVTRVTAFAAGLLLSAGAWAQSSPSHFPAATQPLNGADAVLMDQGSGCASGIQPCATKNSPSTRIGQPVQQTTAPTTPFAYQQWIDTSLSPPQLKMRIGNSWFTVASLSSTAGVGFNVPASAVTGLGTMATQNANAVAITGGTITGMPTPTANSDAATKAYVDGKASGIIFEQGVDYATAAILPNTPVYANGTLGVGRTLTAGSNTTLTVDGTVAILTKRVLVKNQSDQTQNGCYSVTTAGGGVPWVLTGCTDWDQAAEMQTGSSFIAIAGATNAATSWVLNTTGAVVVGSTPLSFVQSAASNIYTAGTGLTLGGSAFSITNTGVAASTYGSATQTGQFSVNAQGQLTTASSVPIALASSAITSGTLLTARGGTNHGDWTTGSIPYASSATVLTQDNANLFYDGSNHRLGLGTTAPNSLFHIETTIADTAVLNLSSGGTSFLNFQRRIGTSTGKITSAGSIILVPSLGGVGIGTFTPNSPLEIESTIADSATLNLTSGGTTYLNFQRILGTSSGKLVSTNSIVLVAGSGGVGIGTLTPSFALDVAGGINATSGFNNGGTAGVTCSPGLPSSSFRVSGGIVIAC